LDNPFVIFGRADGPTRNLELTPPLRRRRKWIPDHSLLECRQMTAREHARINPLIT
jgi:hypothetical protein